MSASTTLPHIETTAPAPPLPAPPLPGWKDEVAERLRAHRTRRNRPSNQQPELPGLAAAPSAVAARVAERYARVPSWRDALAAEAAAKAAAEAAAREAAARAEAAALADAAARTAAEAAAKFEAAAVAQSAATRAAIAADTVPHTSSSSAETADEPPARRPVRSASFLEPAAPSLADFEHAGFEERESGDAAHFQQDTPRYDTPRYDPIRYSVSTDSLPAQRFTPSEARAAAPPRSAVRQVVDAIEEALIEPARSLPARVIEFPRELIAPRKARPRIAEGPLLEPTDDAPPAPPAPEIPGVNAPLTGSALFSQLRIFEADPEEQTGRPANSSKTLPEWHSIHLDSGETMPDTSAPFRSSRFEDLPLYVASFEDRVMAGVVDLALTLAAFLLFVLVFAVCTTHLPAGKVAAGGAAATLLATWILYQLIFFSLGSATPGMKYAKIALCTFKDDNPTRIAMRGRIVAMLLSALPLGLGFLWAAFDEDGLGWHDRITGTYQRSYRGL